MKKLLIIGLLAGCAIAPEKKTESSEVATEIPKWVNAPYEACQEETELCATGEGRNAREADAQARLNLASVFEVKIEANTKVSSAATSSGFAWHADVREDVQQSIQESVHEVLETVQVKKYFRKDQRTHALASLDRRKASELLLGRLKKIDEELRQLWTNRQRTNFLKIMRLFAEREKLNERYTIVSGQGKPQPVRYEEIIQWRDARKKAEPLVLRIGQAPDWMRQRLTELLTESGFKLVRGDAAKVVSMNVDSIKEFLNVEGFEKYTFTLNITSFENGEKKKVLSASETVTGRNQGDALLKVKSYFNEYIEQNLSKLQLD